MWTSLLVCLFQNWMDLSRRVLDCLDLFRKRVFEDDDAVLSYVQDIVNQTLQNDNRIDHIWYILL